jgi:hypothetical protein
MDFAARVAITCMDSVAKYGGCFGLLIDHVYGGYSLIRCRYYRLASSGESTSTLSEDAADGRPGPWTMFRLWLFASRFVHGSHVPVAWQRATRQVMPARCCCSVDLNGLYFVTFTVVLPKMRNSQRHAVFVLQLNRSRRLLLLSVFAVNVGHDYHPWDGTGCTDRGRQFRIE